MQAGAFTPSDVQATTSYVLVNGVRRDVLSWSVDRDIDSDLPAGVAGGAGVSQATGSIEWASLDVDTGALNPWNASTGWLPKSGDKVEIWSGDQVTAWRQFVGVIDTTAGNIGGGITSQIVDRIDDLSVRASLPALVDVMPPLTPAGDWRRFRLSPRWVIAEVLRKAGFYATPAAEAHTTVDVPAFGGMWPHIGEMTRCSQGSNGAASPPFPNGTHVADVTAYYTPRDPRTADKALQLTMNIAAGHAGTASLQVIYGSVNLILRATATEVLFIIGGGATLASVPRTGDTVAQALFKNGAVTLTTSAGKTATGSGAWTSTAVMTEVRITADAASLVNGFIVSHPEQPWHEFANLQWAPSANIATGTMHGVMVALPATRAQSVRDVLDDASRALLLPHWIDENGVMQVISSDLLRARTSVATLTTLDDIRELSWQRDLLGIRSTVTTSYETATINRRKDYSLPVFESGESVVLKSGEQHETIVDPGSDEWVMVDTTPGGVDDTANINAGIGTWVGGIYTDGDTEEWTNLNGHQLTTTMTAVGDGTWKITHTADTLATGKQVELRTVRGDFMGSTVLWPYWWDKNLPIVRAKGTFTTTTVTRPAATAASSGPALEHDCGLWATGNTEGTETSVVDAVTAFLVSQVTDPHPTITDLRIGYDPRIQLGDVITISSPTFMGVELTVLIVGKNTTGGPDGYTLTLTVRVINVHQTFTTWAEWESAWGSTADYTALEAAWGATATYTDFNNTPLKGAPNA